MPNDDPLDNLDYDPEALLKLRGGCRCAWPNGAPPCFACTDPITQKEAIQLDLIPDPDDHF